MSAAAYRLAAFVFVCVVLQPWQGLAADTLADEGRSWGIAPPPGYRAGSYHGPTPHDIPGGRVIKTDALQALIERQPRPMLVDVLSGPPHRTLPDSKAHASKNTMFQEELREVVQLQKRKKIGPGNTNEY